MARQMQTAVSSSRKQGTSNAQEWTRNKRDVLGCVLRENPKRICDPRSYGFFDTKETQNPKKDYFVMTRHAGGTQCKGQNDTSLVLP